jgi:hypothetical protein
MPVEYAQYFRSSLRQAERLDPVLEQLKAK